MTPPTERRSTPDTAARGAVSSQQWDALVRLFWTKVHQTSACWQWRGRPASTGYGRIYVPNGGSRTPLYAHRVSYEIHKGPIPEGLQIDHLCRNRICVNPDHLEAVTSAVNNQRAAPFRPKQQSRLRTHCQRGHPMDDAILVPRPSGRIQRLCRPCERERQRKNDKRPRTTPFRGIGHLGKRDKCKNGHLFSEENTRVVVSPDGIVRRVCRTCQRDRNREYRARVAAR